MKKKVFIAGHNGMVGSAILRRLRLDKDVEIITKSRQELDLVSKPQVETFFDEHDIDQVYLAAGLVGGIVANNPSLLGYSEAKKIFPNHDIKILSIGTGINRRKINGKNSSKWGALNWFNHDILGVMLESSIFHEISVDLVGENYLRINSPTGLVNRRMDDNSEVNLKRIHLMGMEWWSEFGGKTTKFLNL